MSADLALLDERVAGTSLDEAGLDVGRRSGPNAFATASGQDFLCPDVEVVDARRRHSRRIPADSPSTPAR